MNARINMGHLRALGYCSAGIRAWCDANGFSFTELVTTGLAAEQLEASGDALALRAVALSEAPPLQEEPPHHG